MAELARPRVSLFLGDLLEAPGAAICTSTNPALSLQAGTGGAVRLRGGFSIQQECDRVLAEEQRRSGKRYFPLGSAHLTSAGSLPYRAVIHCVAIDHFHGSSTDTIAACVHSALAVAEGHGLSALALPVLATGNGRFDFGTALRVMKDAVEAHPSAVVERVRIVVRDRHRMEEALAVLDMVAVESAGDEALFRLAEPLYQGVLHANYTRFAEAERAEFVASARRARSGIGRPGLERLLWEPGWRPRLVGAWLAGLSGVKALAPMLGRRLLASTLPFAGQGYCFAFACFADDSAIHLERYLEQYLAQPHLDYDQDWALAALVLVDRRLGTGRAGRFLAPRGPWESFVAGRGSVSYLEKLAWLEAMFAFNKRWLA